MRLLLFLPTRHGLPGRAVAVNPDRKLRKVATEHGWEIADWGRSAESRKRAKKAEKLARKQAKREAKKAKADAKKQAKRARAKAAKAAAERAAAFEDEDGGAGSTQHASVPATGAWTLKAPWPRPRPAITAMKSSPW